jgi:hypothetical protein
MTEQDFDDLWKDAVAQYEETIKEVKTSKDWVFSTKKKSPKVSTSPMPHTLDELDTAIESAQSNFTEFQDENAKLRKCIHYALLPIEQLGGMVAEAVSPVWETDLCISFHTDNLLIVVSPYSSYPGRCYVSRQCE